MEFRLEMLSLLENGILANIDSIIQSLLADFRKPEHETWMSEIGIVLEEIRMARKNLRRWAAPKKVSSGLILFPSRARIYYEPRGLSLIIGPWNYPFQLVIEPLVGAIAAGCTAVLKPSELTPHTSKLIQRLISETFPADYIAVAEGGIAETTALLNEKFDHIFFTGSTAVGKVVMAAAAKHLTSVTLELGGKSPAIVDATADLDLAARRIVWGKIFNAGQTCVAPDYVMVEESVAAILLTKMKEQILQQLGHQAQKSPSYSRIISAKHFQRLRQLVDPDKVYYGGGYDEDDLYLQPTILTGVTWSDRIMQEEIFGPLIPVLTFRSLKDCLAKISLRPKPLSGYLFSRSKENEELFLSLPIGGGCINDVLAHFGNPHLPFGGVGDSGMGRYHGRASFETFSHCKGILRRYSWFDLDVRYAPYTQKKTTLLKRLFQF